MLQLAIVISNLCLQPATGNMQLATCILQLATCILQHATCTSHPSISNYPLQPVTCNFNLKHKVCSPRLQMCKLKQHWGLHHHFWCMISPHHHHHHQVEHARYSMTCSIFLCLPLQLIVIHVCVIHHLVNVGLFWASSRLISMCWLSE